MKRECLAAAFYMRCRRAVCMGSSYVPHKTANKTHYHYLYNYITLVKSVLVLFLFDIFPTF